MIDRPTQERFLSHVMPVPWSGCHEWLGALANGRGVFRLEQKPAGPAVAARVAYEIEFGAIPAGLHVLHHCDNPRCVNPAHLYAGTNAENIRDTFARGQRLIKTACSNGHPRTEENLHIAADGVIVCRPCWRVRRQRQKERALGPVTSQEQPKNGSTHPDAPCS